MYPTLEAGEYVAAENLSYKFRDPKVNEIVVVKSPADGRKLVKRIVEKIGDQYKIEGDNKAASVGSRHFGLINRRDILGRVFMV